MGSTPSLKRNIAQSSLRLFSLRELKSRVDDLIDKGAFKEKDSLRPLVKYLSLTLLRHDWSTPKSMRKALLHLEGRTHLLLPRYAIVVCKACVQNEEPASVFFEINKGGLLVAIN